MSIESLELDLEEPELELLDLKVASGFVSTPKIVF